MERVSDCRFPGAELSTPNMTMEPQVKMQSGTATPSLTSLDPNDRRYPGGKGLSGLHQWICARLPAHVFYAEPFAGKAGIFRNKVPALRSWLIDLDGEVITWLHRQIERGSIDPAAGIVAGDDGIRVPGNHRQARRAVIAMVGDGIRWVELAAEWAIPDLLIYADPPYMLKTRVRMGLYRHEMSDADHLRLLTAMKRLCGPAAISGYDSDLYRSELAGWKLHKRRVITRGGTMRTECLWTNQSPAGTSAVAMEYSSLAGSWRERQRIDRKRKRWRENFQRLPKREQRAILLTLLDAARASS